MMRLLIFFVATVMIISCGQSKNNVDMSNPDITTKSINEIVGNNDILSFDINRLKGAAIDITKLTPEDQAVVFAALNRFYSHVKTVDGLWTVDVTSGEQIGMAEDLFQFFLDDVNKNMETVKQLRAEGKEVDVPEITEEYLKSLLNPYK